ncbi:helix-turn-helix domain-containing protein [Clostridium folliculivorans]|uniref:Helix-turn-helix conjugative transposon-like domain-containing protein n=1 Tax=Clostridium folliculivorans TaxID=2886038 RepID=A0A9W5XZU4_9CLOT|nr:helix-turn-helix domain-containing protein [Clostridium folliculivorans]GKU24081.1 hypothetical protein CFOLD11_09070 [Clostridium folliculivorans]GKU30187.1 hypothetical protein CFB3_22940 [Clostridium folliculivorans]
MDYEQIEDLVIAAKSGDLTAKEMLMVGFTPFIKKLYRTSMLYLYEREDLENECYKTLFKCIFYYNCDNHSFVAYTTNAIKHNINNLIKLRFKRLISEGNKTLIMDEIFVNHLAEDNPHFEDQTYIRSYNSNTQDFVNEISDCDKELINFVFYDKKRIKEHSPFKNIALKYPKKIMYTHEIGHFLN